MENLIVSKEQEIMEKRLEELEIKTSYLEKELEEYKEASRSLYARLNAMEEEIKFLRKGLPDNGRSTPEATWDAENHQIRT